MVHDKNATELQLLKMTFTQQTFLITKNTNHFRIEILQILDRVSFLKSKKNNITLKFYNKFHNPTCQSNRQISFHGSPTKFNKNKIN